MLFSEEMVKQVLDNDEEYGYNFKDPTMADCFEALNTLPRRDMRRIVQRIHARKPIAATLGSDLTKALS